MCCTEAYDVAKGALSRLVEDVRHLWVELERSVVSDDALKPELSLYSKFWAATSGLRSLRPFLPSMAWISPQAPPRSLLW